jgi:hypothetical protein
MDSAAAKNVAVYWRFTVPGVLFFAVPGIAFLLRVPRFTEDMAILGYPAYFLIPLEVGRQIFCQSHNGRKRKRVRNCWTLR